MIHQDVIRLLISLGSDVIRTPKGFKNGQVFQLAKKEARILLTQDKDFSDSKRYPPSLTAGIICLRVFPPTIANLLSHVKKFIHKTTPADIKGELTILS